jgi:hypothetical protein
MTPPTDTQIEADSDWLRHFQPGDKLNAWMTDRLRRIADDLANNTRPTGDDVAFAVLARLKMLEGDLAIAAAALDRGRRLAEETRKTLKAIEG